MPGQADAFEELIKALQGSLAAIREIPAYTATFEQQVCLGDEVRDTEWMDLKLRREPFGVYMKWQRDGQELLYCDGHYDGDLLVRPTRGLIALRGTWKLRPDSSQAMRGSRYPVTAIGIERLCERILKFHEERGFAHGSSQWSMGSQRSPSMWSSIRQINRPNTLGRLKSSIQKPAC
jgi:hypothetical protein